VVVVADAVVQPYAVVVHLGEVEATVSALFWLSSKLMCEDSP
jgi:hypothetical protein